MRFALVVVLAVAGCNELLDLSSTAVGSVDSDGDGIADDYDNCPMVANSDQRDSDGDHQGDACDSCPFARPTTDADADGIDDACDPCPLGRNHDEDGDGIFDACDICPGTPDPDQIDTDGDGVGDLCDPSTGSVEKRVIFDAFAPPATEWSATVPWQPTPDGDGFAPTGPDSGLTFVRSDGVLMMNGKHQAYQIGVKLPATFAAGESFGIAIIDRAAQTIRCIVDCTVSEAATACHLSLEASSPTQMGPDEIAAGGSGTLHLQLDIGQQKTTVHCSYTGATELIAYPVSSPTQMVTLGSSPTIELSHVDLVE